MQRARTDDGVNKVPLVEKDFPPLSCFYSQADFLWQVCASMAAWLLGSARCFVLFCCRSLTHTHTHTLTRHPSISVKLGAESGGRTAADVLL